ncbi:GNAT family N-acetyltransferase [Paraburkholderia unamae]|uniref:GNAT family N-acyltransferase n=1 Tax=Paraburkholderia unamae TaxID=219649 RepID=A0ABX5KPB7_9BURK|nr:GNAT family N-acetyltransferase [Paraburkholderia unamae]PVX82260.1 putative GNAT family N-acyltransferase [Paraburkholderia unamae]RAR60589.1 putative GNAT family N-acyltransferase [Paraburkholderia unamae]CAG9250601.1 Predicted N-acyltransferase, GNAT family [Paraburkholderia unamae]
MNWKTLEFDQFTARELYLIMRARSAVFVVEQSHVCLDADGHDERSLHVFAVEDMGKPMPVVAYARIRPGDAEDPEIIIDKVLTSPARRGDGTAELLIERALAAIVERWPGRAVRVSAPATLRGFYEQFGFRKAEGPFLEHGVPFIGLVRHMRGEHGVFTARRRERGALAAASTFELL